MDADDLTIGQIRRMLTNLVSLAHTAERPKPDVINPPGHNMPGYEWHIVQGAPYAVRPPQWVVRSVDDSEARDCIYVAQPDPYVVADWQRELEFVPMTPVDGLNLAMVLIAAVERCQQLTGDIPRLHERRTR